MFDHRSTHRRWAHATVTVFAVMALTVTAACSSGDNGDDPTAPGAPGLAAERDIVVGLLLDESAAEGIVLDETCTRDVVARMPDDDIVALATAADPDTVEVSTEGQEIGSGIVDCVDTSTLAEALADDLERQGLSPDRDCLADALSGTRPTDLLGDGTIDNDELTVKLEACLNLP